MQAKIKNVVLLCAVLVNQTLQLKRRLSVFDKRVNSVVGRYVFINGRYHRG